MALLATHDLPSIDCSVLMSRVTARHKVNSCITLISGFQASIVANLMGIDTLHLTIRVRKENSDGRRGCDGSSSWSHSEDSLNWDIVFIVFRPIVDSYTHRFVSIKVSAQSFSFCFVYNIIIDAINILPLTYCANSSRSSLNK